MIHPLHLSHYTNWTTWLNPETPAKSKNEIKVRWKIALRFKGGCQKKRFFWDIFPKCGWVGWLIPKQGPNPSKPPQITPNCTAGKLYYATSADSGAAGFSSGTSWPSFSAMNFSRAAASLSTNKINYEVRQQRHKIIMNINSLKHLFPLYLTPSSLSAPLLKNFSVG